jgi:hypothetical protein
MLGRQNYTQHKPLVPESGAFKVELAIEKHHQLFISSQENWLSHQVKQYAMRYMNFPFE